jgi:hypothetical protein
MNEEFERICKEVFIAQLRYYTSICLEGLWKTGQLVSQLSNQAPPEQKYRKLLLC